MLQFTSVYDHLFTYGINQHDSPDNIAEGFVEDAVNVDVEATTLTRRRGFDIFAGEVPIRIEQLQLLKVARTSSIFTANHTTGVLTMQSNPVMPVAGDVITLYTVTTGVLPAGLSTGSYSTGVLVGTAYYVTNVVGFTLRLSSTPTLALAGTSDVTFTDDGTAPCAAIFLTQTTQLILPSYVDLTAYATARGDVEVTCFYNDPKGAAGYSVVQRLAKADYTITVLQGVETAYRTLTLSADKSSHYIQASSTFMPISGIIRGIRQTSLPVPTIINYIDSYLVEDVNGSPSSTIVGVDGILLRSVEEDTANNYYTYDSRAGGLSTGAATYYAVSPLFQPTALPATSVSTRGNIITEHASAGGYVPVITVAYNAGTTHTDYTISIPDNVSDLAGIISTTWDYLTITGLTNFRFNGTFKITAVDNSIRGTLIISTINAGVNKSIWNATGLRGLAGVFTDRLRVGSIAAFSATVGDPIESYDNLPGPAYVSTTLGSYLGTITSPNNQIALSNVNDVVNVSQFAYISPNNTTTSITLPSGAFPYLPGDVIQAVGIDRLGNYGLTTVLTEVLSITQTTGSVTVITFRDAIPVTSGRCHITRPEYWQIIPSADGKLGIDYIDRAEMQRSVLARNSLYLASGVKYDGDKLYRTGLPSLQVQAFIAIDEASTTGLLPFPASVPASLITSVTASTLTFANANLVTKFNVGDNVAIRETTAGVTNVKVSDGNTYLITSIDSTNFKINLSQAYTPGGTSQTLVKYIEYDYYARLSLIDRNGNLIVGPSVGSGDLRIRLTAAAGVRLKFVILPDGTENIDYSRVNIEIFRRNNSAVVTTSAALQAQTSVYHKVGQIPLSTAVTVSGQMYVEFTDSMDEHLLTDIDPVVDALGGIGENRSAPYSAALITGINNQLIYGNLSTDPQIKLGLVGANSAEADFDSKTFVLTTYDDDTYATSSPKTFEVVASTNAKSVTMTAYAAPHTSFTFTVPATYDSPVSGTWIYIAKNDQYGVVTGTKYLGWWKTTTITGTTITVSGVNMSSDIASETANLKVYFPSNPAYIPLAGNIQHYNMNAAVGYVDATDPRARFPYHLATAINAVYGYYSGLSRLSNIYARGGLDLSSGTTIIMGKRLKSININSAIGSLLLFNEGKVASYGSEIPAQIVTYSARAILSVPYFPEVFSEIDVDSSKIVPQVQDVSPDDGEELTGMLPFFAQSAFGAAMLDSALVMFKPRSVYIMDSQGKYVGSTDYFKKLETRGVGCMAPGSITSSAAGLMFTSKAGIFMLNRSYDLVNVGHRVERFFLSTLIDRNLISRACCCNYGQERQFLLNLPIKGDSEDYTGTTFVFKFGEDGMLDLAHLPTNYIPSPQTELPVLGAWTRYTGFYATLYSNRDSEVYFGTDKGYVGKILDDGADTDYADMGKAIECTVLFRASDGGIPFVRKLLKFATLHLESRVGAPAGDITAYSCNDFSEQYFQLDPYKLTGSQLLLPTDIGDVSRERISRVAFSPKRTHGTWFSIKLIAKTLHANLSINRLIYTMAAIRERGTTEAAQTTK